MKRFFAGVLFAALSSTILVARPSDHPSPERVRALTLEGLHHLYNFDVGKANERFNEAIAVNPHHPRPQVSRIIAPLWKFLVTRADSDFQEVTRLTTECIDAGEKYLESNENDADALTCLGTAYGFRAYAHAVDKSYLKAAWDGRKSYGYLADAVRADPHFYDAYLWLGLYHFAVGTIPKTLQWIVGILGIEGNRDLGLREIELAARKGMYNAPEAKYLLVQFYPWYKGDFEASEKLIDELLHTYPANTVFLYSKGFMKLRQNDVTAALPYFLKMKELNNGYFSLINKYAELRMGECYFRSGDYKRAQDGYLRFLAMNNRGQFEAMASYHAGLAAELMGDRASALTLYLRAKSSDAVHGDDVYAARHAAKLLVSPLSTVDSLLIVARNFHRSGSYKKATDTYADLLHRFSCTDDQHAEALYRTGECLFEQDRYDEAVEQFRAVLRLKVTSEQWVKPWAHFMMGQIALKKNDLVVARKEFEIVGDYDNYDHKNWLTFRAEQELEKLKNTNGGTR